MEEKTRTKTANRLRVIAQEYFSDTMLNVRKQLLEIADAYDEQNKEIERLKKVILLAPGSDERDFLKKYRKWWDTYYRELRTPGCNVLTIEQALKGGSLKS